MQLSLLEKDLKMFMFMVLFGSFGLHGFVWGNSLNFSWEKLCQLFNSPYTDTPKKVMAT